MVAQKDDLGFSSWPQVCLKCQPTAQMSLWPLVVVSRDTKMNAETSSLVKTAHLCYEEAVRLHRRSLCSGIENSGHLLLVAAKPCLSKGRPLVAVQERAERAYLRRHCGRCEVQLRHGGHSLHAQMAHASACGGPCSHCH